ncbi:MAG: PDZ domain-containing protein [Pirellulales bacterium]|nr:PDZ domain-containing protein [Pirellulales bacterium]
MCIWLALVTAAAGADDLTRREDQAFRAAVDRVAPSVVRIETVGGLERVGRVEVGSAATTGLIVSADGYIVSSAFNFAQDPSSILVTLPDGERHAARLVGTDSNRMVTLLKVEAKRPLAVPEAAEESSMHVGAWAIAVGKAYDTARPNLSVGIISGLSRIWGKAIQTDAKISPLNYGGPLVDLDGRVLGILVPLSPDEQSEVAGAEWYDSGIGFAIPLAHIEQVLPRLREGDLRSGLLGVSLKSASLFGEPAIVGAVRPNSPAYRAGIKPGDRIAEIDGSAIESHAAMRSELNPRYAGDQISLVVLRGEERLEHRLELVGELPPYAHPFIGVLPLRDPATGVHGIVVRYVYHESPASRAGLAPGDRITHIGGHAVNSLEEVWEALARFAPSETIELQWTHGEEMRSAEIELAALPTDLPPVLPASHGALPGAAEQRPSVGKLDINVPEFTNKCVAYVPSDYDPRVPHGLVLWLHGAGGGKSDELIERFRPMCEARDLILVAPQAADAGGWKPTEERFIQGALAEVIKSYNIDSARVVAAGEGTGGSLAYAIAFAQREKIRAVAAINAPPAGKAPDNDPLQRLAIYSASSAKSASARAIRAGLEKLETMKFPVTRKDLGETERPLSADELLDLGRWIDALDRI